MYDDDVVEDFYVEDLSCLTEAPGDALIVAGGLGVTGGVVVGDDDGSGSVAQRVAEHLARGHERVIHRPDGHRGRGDQPVLDIEVERHCVLAVQTLQERDEQVGRFFRTRDLGAVLRGAGPVDAGLLAGASVSSTARPLATRTRLAALRPAPPAPSLGGITTPTPITAKGTSVTSAPMTAARSHDSATTTSG